MENLIKINYDDYYKFLVSSGLVCIILFVISILYFDSKTLIKWNLLTDEILLIILLFFIGLIIYGGYKWKKRQDIYDDMLNLQHDSLDYRVQKLKLSAEKGPLQLELSRKRVIEKIGSEPEKLSEELK